MIHIDLRARYLMADRGYDSQAVHHTQYYPVYADCNAIAPRTVQAIAKTFTDSDSLFIDAGIIGLAPQKDRAPTRFYCSGTDTTALEMLDGGGLRVHRLGSNIGQASAMKMIYAAVTKGTMTLHAAVLTAAQLQGLFPIRNCASDSSNQPITQRKVVVGWELKHGKPTSSGSSSWINPYRLYVR